MGNRKSRPRIVACVSWHFQSDVSRLLSCILVYVNSHHIREGEEDFPRISRIFKISFDIPQFSYSDLKVNQLRVSSEGYKPYKGVRGRASGQIEWRWELDMALPEEN